MATFQADMFRSKLSKLTDSTQSIQTLSHWVQHHRKASKESAAVWAAETLRRQDGRERLTMVYLANDILQNSKRKGAEFVRDYGRVLPNVLPVIYSTCDSVIQGKLMRMIGIWDERRVLPTEDLGELRRKMSQGDVGFPPDMPPAAAGGAGAPSISANSLGDIWGAPDAIGPLGSIGSVGPIGTIGAVGSIGGLGSPTAAGPVGAAAGSAPPSAPPPAAPAAGGAFNDPAYAPLPRLYPPSVSSRAAPAEPAAAGATDEEMPFALDDVVADGPTGAAAVSLRSPSLAALASPSAAAAAGVPLHQLLETLGQGSLPEELQAEREADLDLPSLEAQVCEKENAANAVRRARPAQPRAPRPATSLPPAPPQHTIAPPGAAC